MMNPNDVGDPLTFLLAPPAGKSYSYHVNYLNNSGWISTSFVTYIHGPQMMNHVMTTTHGTQRMTPPYCGDPLSFPLPPPAVQSFTYSVQYFNTYLTFTVPG